MSMYNLVEYSDNFSNISGILWQYYKYEPFLDNNGAATDFTTGNNNTALFEFKTKISDATGNDGTKSV